MTQPHILELAKQGDPQAIAVLMNQSLQPRGMTATVERQEDLLEIILEAERVPSREALTAFVQKGIANLGVESIRFIRIVGQQTGAVFPAWMQELDLAIAPSALPDTALPDAALPHSAMPNLQTAPSVGMDAIAQETAPEITPELFDSYRSEPLMEEPLMEEPLEDLGAIAPEYSALSFSEFAEEEALPESLPDTLDFEGLNFEAAANSQELLSDDPQQRRLEDQLESLWAEQSVEPSQDFDLSLDVDDPISEEEFQDLFAEDLSDPQDFFPGELPGEEPVIESTYVGISTDSVDMDDLFGEPVSSPESSFDLAEPSFDLGTDDLGTDDLGTESASSFELGTDFFLDEPLDSLETIAESSTESSPESVMEPEIDLFADSSPSFVSDVSIPDVSSFNESDVSEAAPESLLQDLLAEDPYDFSVSSPDETPVDAAIADLFAEDMLETQPSEPQPEFTEATSESVDNWLTAAAEAPLLDQPDFFSESAETSDAPEAGALDDFAFTGGMDNTLDLPETQAIPSELFVEDLQGVSEAPIEYVFGEALETPIAQDPYATFAPEELFTEPVPEPQHELPLLEEQLDGLWADQSAFALEEEPLLDLTASTDPAIDLAIDPAIDPSEDLFEPLVPDEPVSGTHEQPDFFGEQSEEESLTFGLEDDFLLEPTDELLDRSDESDLIGNPNAVLLDLPSEGLPPEDLLSEDLLSEGLLEPIAPEDFSLDLSDNPLDEQSDSLFQNLPEDESEELFSDDTDPLAALSLDDLEAEADDSLEASNLAEEDAFIDEALIDNAIAGLPPGFLDDSFSDQTENLLENPLDSEPPEASIDVNLSDFSDFSDNLPDEPLASLMHETSPDDLGIEFLNEELLDEIDLGLEGVPSQSIESTLEPAPVEDSIAEDSDLNLPLDFLDDRSTDSMLRNVPDDRAESDLDLELDDDFLNLPSGLLDPPADSPLEGLFSEPSAPAIDRQSFSMEDMMPSQLHSPEEMFSEEEAIDFLQEDVLTEAEAEELPEDQVEELLTGLPDWDEAIDAMQDSEGAGFAEGDFVESSLENALDNDRDEDIGNLSLELDPEVYSDEDTSIASTFDGEWLNPLDDEIETYREVDESLFTEPDEESLSESSELSQEQLEAQLEEFDRGSVSSEGYGSGDRGLGGHVEGNGQVDGYLPPALITTEDSGASWLFTTVLVGVSGLVAGLLGYSLWSKMATPPAPQPSAPQPSAPQPSVAPAPVQPSSTLPSAPPADPAVPPADPAVPPVPPSP